MYNNVSEMTRPELEALLAEKPALILPVGACEQHGPHLPMGTDNYLVCRLAQMVGEDLGIAVLPAMNYGYSWVWKDIVGSAWISMKLFEDFLVELALHYAAQGIKVLAVLNGHGANEAATKYACRRVAETSDLNFLYFTYPGLLKAAEEVAESESWYGMIHACEIETSMLLAVRPDLVHMERAVKEYPPRPQLYEKSGVVLGSLSESGVFGDATLAAADKGNYILKKVAGLVTDDVRCALRQAGIKE